MAAVTGAGAPAWHESVREDARAAWFALDQLQLKLDRQAELHGRYLQPGARRLGDFKEEFGALADALILLVVDELFPVPDDELDQAGDDCPDAVGERV